MKDLFTEIVQALVDHPEEVTVTLIGGSHTTVLEVKKMQRWIWDGSSASKVRQPNQFGQF